MNTKNLWIVIVFGLMLAMYPSEFPLASEDGGQSAVGPSVAPKARMVRLAKFRLDDFLKELGKQDSREEPREGTQEDQQKPPKKKSRMQRRIDLLEGIGTLLSSTGEIDYKSELTIGESLALEGFRRYGMPVSDDLVQKYVNLVGLAVARNSLRPNIPYWFVVVDNPIQNAFACPGGIIFISAGLLKTIQNEAQLASVLAHEVGHVGHKHALKSIQRARFFQGVGKITATAMKGEKGRQFQAMMGDLQTILFDRGLDKNMEFEADLAAMETAYRTGYDPTGMPGVLRELKRMEARSRKAGSWFSTHPPLSQRIQRCENQLGRYRDWKGMAKLPVRYSWYRKRIP